MTLTNHPARDFIHKTAVCRFVNVNVIVAAPALLSARAKIKLFYSVKRRVLCLFTEFSRFIEVKLIPHSPTSIGFQMILDVGGGEFVHIIAEHAKCH